MADIDPADAVPADAVPDRRALPAAMQVDRMAMADGWTLRRMAWAPEHGVASRGRMLFLSGRADFGEKYLEAMAHWRARGWAVTSFDWRGQGGSSASPAAATAPEPGFALLLDDLAAMVADATGAGPLVAIAHSMGAHIALRLIAERGWRPAAAVLVAPMIGIASGPLPPAAAAFVARAMCALGLGERRVWRARAGGQALRQTTLTGSAERYADERWWVERVPGYRALPPRWAWLDAAYRSIAALGDARLEEVRVPLLILGAEHDRLVSARAIAAAAARLPNARLLTIPGAAHELLREADPARLAALAAIDRFLDESVPA